MDAQAFFNELTEYSRRLLARLKLPGESPWGTPTMSQAPQGAILHYTADSDARRVVRWFCDPALSSKCSAHLVVGDRKYDWAQGLDDDLPLVRALPVTVVQTRLYGTVAWHATWTNPTCYGIECVNVGEVRKSGADWVWWVPRDKSAPEWTSRWVSDKTPVVAFGRFWEPYTPGQCQAVVTCLQAVLGLSNSIEKAWLVGHECVQGRQTPGTGLHDKRDPGHVFPIHQVREAVFSGGALPPGLESGAAWRQATATAALRAAGLGEGPDAMASLGAVPLLRSAAPVPLAKAMLRLLGYYVDEMGSPELSFDAAVSVYLFQRLMGLGADGQLGPQTYDALTTRFADRFGKAPLVA